VLAGLFGLTPLWTLHNLLVLLLVLVLRVNLSIFIIAWGFFTVLAFALDPVFDGLGHAVLTAEPLRPLWSTLYATDIGRLSAFNNTIVMGSLCAGLILAPVFWFATIHLVRNYRTHMLDWVRRRRIYQIISGSRLLTTYQSLRG
jgi:uncharacterized protein (TIGR03546 family)